jgi:putative flippase GtrA
LTEPSQSASEAGTPSCSSVEVVTEGRLGNSFLELGRFAVIGCANTLIDFGVFWLGARDLGIPIILANVTAWLVAFTFSYLVNGHFTFHRGWDVLLSPRYYCRVALGNCLSLLLTTIILLVAASRMPLVLAKILSIGVGFAVNFLTAKYIRVR